MDPNTIIELLMQLLTQSPNEPAGNTPHGLPAAGVPADVLTGNPEHDQLAMMLQLLQQIQMQQSAQQAMNGAHGALGGMFGSLGGRPRGS
jgi:hypothetical protein